MSRLPTRLQPAWPMLKRLHRALAWTSGVLGRRLSPILGLRGLPRTATTTSLATAALEAGRVEVHEVGPAESFDRRVPSGVPSEHWRFVQASRAEVPARYVLDVTDGRLVGDFGATVTPGGVLDYQTSGYFGLASWREHPVFLKPTIGTIVKVEGTVLSLATRGTASNYYHYLYDAIGRYGIYEESGLDHELDAIVVPHQTRYQRQLLDLLGIDVPLIEPKPGTTIQADRLLVPSTPNQDLDAPRSTTAWLRSRLHPTDDADGPRRVYISRGSQPNSRRYVQEAELMPHLVRRGFTVVDPGSFTVQEQIDLFSGAEVVVAPHGAGLTNIVFAQPGTKVLEMFAASYVHLGLWTIAESVGGLDYSYLVAEGDHSAGRPMTGVLDDVSIPVERVVEAIDQLLAGPS